MGARGPSKKPTALKVLEGNPGKRPINENEPKYELSEAGKKAPPWMGPHGKKEWKRILPLLEKNGLLTDADYMTLCGYCQSVDTWVEAEKIKRTEGLVIETSKGTEVPHPAVTIASNALSAMLKCAREFGLTPASRADVSADGFEESENPVLTLMKRARKEG